MLRKLALAAIQFYQRHISPYKGFCCAYRFHTGRVSCSQLGYRAISRLGLWRGLIVLRRRLIRCGITHRRYQQAKFRPLDQAGFCDCDLPCNVDAGSACELAANLPCDCGADWSRKNDKAAERYVHIPPNSMPRKLRII
ncbi:membrane protein insertion efficiency factor YidD [Azonexus sp. IMCC34839]|uniref:membrane protein insertion efficiency factor YidD n=1 Tax=Azonexus sp. IMCC34839 TaxID=3133695 RepID=UPI00399C0C08